MRRRTVQLSPVFGPCTLAADTIDADRRTVEAVFLSGQPIPRTPLFEDPYWLEFDMTSKAADLSRLNAGAAVLDSHRSYGGVSAVLGKVEAARISGGKAHATLRFSKRPEVDGVWQDVADGILGSVSMGVYLEELEELPKEEGSDMRRFAVRRWQPYELSIVAVPADAGARIEAAADTERRPCRLTTLTVEATMRKRTKCPECKTELAADYTESTCPNAECGLDFEEHEAEQREAARVGRIHQLAAHFELGETWAQRHIRDGSSADDAAADGRRERARLAPDLGGLNPSAGADYDSPGFRIEAMAAGLADRARGVEPTDLGRRYYNASPVELAFELLRAHGLHRGLDVRRNASRIIELAAGTSDYPNILGNAVNRLLQPEYEQAAPTYRQICARRDFRDFRSHSFVRLGDFPNLLEVGENGEITQGHISESGETVTAANYARIYAISRPALVNDDVMAFADLAMKAGRRVAAFENGLFFTVLTSGAGGLGPTMSDGVQLFNATHANTGSGAIDVTNVGSGVAAIMKQTGLDGVKLNLEPAVLLTSPDRVAVGRQFVAQNLRPTQPSEANPFANLTALADANLTTAAPWYLFAGPGAQAGFVYGYVDGGNGPRVDSRMGWETEGLQVRCSLDFGVGVIDYRGCYRSTGS